MSATNTPESCLLCTGTLPDQDDAANGYNPEHVWARCYACPPCLVRYPTDELAMCVIRTIAATAERERVRS